MHVANSVYGAVPKRSDNCPSFSFFEAVVFFLPYRNFFCVCHKQAEEAALSFNLEPLGGFKLVNL